MFSCLSCDDNSHIEPEKLAHIYVDLLVVEDYYSNSDSLTVKRNEFFEKYKVKEENYDSTFKYFKYNQKEWDYFFELANSYLDSLKAREKSGKLKSVP